MVSSGTSVDMVPGKKSVIILGGSIKPCRITLILPMKFRQLPESGSYEVVPIKGADLIIHFSKEIFGVEGKIVIPSSLVSMAP